MDINATLLGQAMTFSAIIIGLVSYFLGRRKTQTPVLAGIIGAVLGLIPLFGIIYLVVLVLKNDVALTHAEAHK